MNMTEEEQDQGDDVMTDADFERALDALREEGNNEVGDLLSEQFSFSSLNVYNCSPNSTQPFRADEREQDNQLGGGGAHNG
jgi:hypothetical protein